MATSDGGRGRQAARSAGRYLTSTRNLVGALGGLAGLALAFTGLLDDWWPLGVAALYAAGALVAPSEKVQLTESAGVELHNSLSELSGRLAARQQRLPAEAVERFARMRGKLGDLLDREAALAADPEAGYELDRIIRRDLPEAFEAYLNVPWRFQSSLRLRGVTTAADQLHEQLELLEQGVDDAAAKLLEADARRQQDHTTYLRQRSRRSGLAPDGGGDGAAGGDAAAEHGAGCGEDRQDRGL